MVRFSRSGLRTSDLGLKMVWTSALWRPLVLVLVWSVPGPADGFRVGVVGPWDCDPLFAKALPLEAAQLAINRINRDQNLSHAHTLSFSLLQAPCESSRGLKAFLGFHTKASAFTGALNPGLCESAAMIAKDWNKALYPWGCLGSDLDDTRHYPTLTRSVARPEEALLRVLRYFRWAHVAVLSSTADLWRESAVRVADSLRSRGLPVSPVVFVEDTPHSIRSTLIRIRNMKHLRVVLLVMHSALVGGALQRRVLEWAYDLGLADGSVAFVPFDSLLFSLPYGGVAQAALSANGKLRRAYDAVLTVTVDSPPNQSFYHVYADAVANGELPTTRQPHQVSPLFGTLYTSVLLVAHSLHRLREKGEWLSGGNLARSAANLQFQGFNHRVKTDGSGSVLTDFVILDSDGQSSELRATHRIDLEAGLVRFLGSEIHFPGAWGRGPAQDASCWFTPGVLCSGGMDLFSTFIVFLWAVVSFISVITLTYGVRRRVVQFRMVRGPNKIRLTLDDVTFINPSLSNKRLSGELSSRLSGLKSVSTLSQTSESDQTPATYENSNVIIFEGDWAWLKRLPDGSFNRLNKKTSDVFELMKDMRHENVNPFLGFFHDVGVFAVVTEFCSRGSLEDLLQNHDVKLDWMFKSSLLLDLIKGMKYLHHRKVVHTRLKSRNCVVDGRFVLKVTDFGFNEVLEAQRFPYCEPPADDLLWTAPEILRSGQAGLHGSQAGDVFSFSIIMQEVVVRGGPFCMLELSSEEVVEKLRRPPPLCRPLVSPDYAPMECIQLMKQCWNEQPDKRPDFEEIFDQFKNINKGKKTNIIDSMLRMLEQYSSNLEELIRERTEELEIEKQKTEKLLTQMLPPSVAEALKVGGTVVPEYFDTVSLYFSDIVGFTTISANSEPIEVVDLLNDLYTLFDAIIGNHDVYKVETIGDAYMVASGLPVPNGNRHAAEIANMALDILSAVGTFKMRHMPDVPVRIRIGLHTGSCVAGVVGLTMPRYCLFGDTVTTASRMESTGMPYRIHVHQSTVKVLEDLNLGYKLVLRGRTEVRGKGIEETYWLTGRTGFTKPLPVPPELKSGRASSLVVPSSQRNMKQVLHKAVKMISHVRVVTQLYAHEEENVMMSHH